MHSRQTVRYICEEYVSGNCYYYKSEIITHDNWKNLDSLSWSRPRPISKKTFMKQKKAGYKTEHKFIKKEPAVVVSLHRTKTV
ncbi:hypothetical protein AWM68_18160 [Fictibacillus phosphorivorans]|uniref:Uncharacterized protein n=1 Tax=Fictibacillus phosphorivorans TaxID=1221500 RepID=A0A163RZY6_9BACL|nr:hypothetical protein [Fictibacillus phosphorivorans]KZE67848.1 hypothetical protein AWM68_18160 [Fictibacillus phosphorivorans]